MNIQLKLRVAKDALNHIEKDQYICCALLNACDRHLEEQIPVCKEDEFLNKHFADLLYIANTRRKGILASRGCEGYVRDSFSFDGNPWFRDERQRYGRKYILQCYIEHLENTL